MTPVLLLAVALAGGAGAVIRWLIEAVVNRRTGGAFPWGVLLVNITGCLLLGVVAGSLDDGTVAQLIGTGFLGGYTTFSSVAATTALLLDRRRTRAALANAIGTLVLSVAAASLGLAIGHLLA